MRNNEQIAIELGEARKRTGMTNAASSKRVPILRGRIALIEAMLSTSDRIATTDDACDDLLAEYPDSGKWRGSIPKSLVTAGIIEKHGFTCSKRVSRHRSAIFQWRLIDEEAAVAELTRLRVELDMIQRNVDRDTAEKAVYQRTIRALQDGEGSP